MDRWGMFTDVHWLASPVVLIQTTRPTHRHHSVKTCSYLQNVRPNNLIKFSPFGYLAWVRDVMRVHYLSFSVFFLQSSVFYFSVISFLHFVVFSPSCWLFHRLSAFQYDFQLSAWLQIFGQASLTVRRADCDFVNCRCHWPHIMGRPFPPSTVHHSSSPPSLTLTVMEHCVFV